MHFVYSVEAGVNPSFPNTTVLKQYLLKPSTKPHFNSCDQQQDESNSTNHSNQEESTASTSMSSDDNADAPDNL